MRSSTARAIVRIAHFVAAGILIAVVVYTPSIPVAILFAIGAAGFIVRGLRGVK